MYFTQLSDEYKYWKIIKMLKQYYQHISLVQKKRVVGFRPIVNANMHAYSMRASTCILYTVRIVERTSSKKLVCTFIIPRNSRDYTNNSMHWVNKN